MSRTSSLMSLDVRPTGDAESSDMEVDDVDGGDVWASARVRFIQALPAHRAFANNIAYPTSAELGYGEHISCCCCVPITVEL